MRSKLLITFTVLAIIGAVEGNVFAQSKGRLPLLPGSSPLVPLGPRSQGTTGSRDRGEVITIREARAGNVDRANLRHVDGIVTSNKSTVDPDTPGLTTIPHWSDSFTYHGLVYKYTMVGTDPKRGSATTVIPTVLIPIRFVFADGNVFDPTTDIVNGLTPIQGIINSPIFQNYDFNNNQGNYYFGGMANPVKVGNTQYGDAFQRANFWDTVSTRAPNYHVLLGQPTVLPIQTINVPNGLFSYYFDPNAGQLLPEVDEAFLEGQTGSILTAANVSASMLPIMVWGKVGGTDALGFHGVISGNGIPLQTYHCQQAICRGPFVRTSLFSVTKYWSGWTIHLEITSRAVGTSRVCFLLMSDATAFPDGGRDLLEVADPIEFFFDGDISIPAPTYTYHVTEAMFIDFYTRSSRSRSYNGQYSFFEIGIPYGVMMEPSSPVYGACRIHTDLRRFSWRNLHGSEWNKQSRFGDWLLPRRRSKGARIRFHWLEIFNSGLSGSSFYRAVQDQRFRNDRWARSPMLPGCMDFRIRVVCGRRLIIRVRQTRRSTELIRPAT